mgnify:CR=1 FL=1
MFNSRAADGHNGFHMTFANGYSVSVQFGSGNYCENCDGKETHSKNAEVAAWDADDKWIKLDEHDDVLGWQSPDQVLAIMNRIAAL